MTDWNKYSFGFPVDCVDGGTANSVYATSYEDALNGKGYKEIPKPKQKPKVIKVEQTERIQEQGSTEGTDLNSVQVSVMAHWYLC